MLNDVWSQTCTCSPLETLSGNRKFGPQHQLGHVNHMAGTQDERGTDSLNKLEQWQTGLPGKSSPTLLS